MIESNDHTNGASKDVVGTDRFPESPAVQALLKKSHRLLRARLRMPEGVISCRWSASDLNAHALDLNETLPLTAAWRRLDPEVARDIVRSAFAAQAEDGSLTRAFFPNGTCPVEGAPWPTFCQSTLLLELENPGPDFRSEMLPRLVRYMEWAFRYFDPAETGRPRWRSESESLAPAAWDECLYSADLAALLLAESDALFRLGVDPDAAVGIQLRSARVVEELRSFFWDPETHIFRDRYRDGRWVVRITWAAILPLIWRHLPANRAEEASNLLKPNGPLAAEVGIPLWECWSDDPIPPPMPSAQQALLLAGLQLAGRQQTAALVQTRLAEGLERALSRGAPCPADMAATGEVSLRSTGAALVAQVFMFRATRAEAGFEGARQWKRMEKQRGLIVGGAIAVLLAMMIFVATWWQQRRPPPGPSLEALIGLAQNHYRRGEIDEALRLCRDIVERWDGEAAAGVRFLYANALFRSGHFEEAAKQYQLAATHPEIEPIARFNLAQTTLRLGQRREAIAQFTAIVKDFHESFPEVAERAQRSTDFLQERLKTEETLSNSSNDLH